jgi:hypothetical protein
MTPCDIHEGGGGHFGNDLHKCRTCGHEAYPEVFKCPCLRLMEIAPDTLAALQMVRELDDAYGIEFSEQQRDQLHDAIRKATGAS